MGMYRERMERNLTSKMAPRWNVAERERRQRWERKSLARVTHQKYGSVVVPHCSNLAAIMNAAEVWRCDWAEITDATVYAAEPDAVPASMPYII